MQTAGKIIPFPSMLIPSGKEFRRGKLYAVVVEITGADGKTRRGEGFFDAVPGYWEMVKLCERAFPDDKRIHDFKDTEFDTREKRGVVLTRRDGKDIPIGHFTVKRAK